MTDKTEVKVPDWIKIAAVVSLFYIVGEGIAAIYNSRNSEAQRSELLAADVQEMIYPTPEPRLVYEEKAKTLPSMGIDTYLLLDQETGDRYLVVANESRGGVAIQLLREPKAEQLPLEQRDD